MFLTIKKAMLTIKKSVNKQKLHQFLIDFFSIKKSLQKMSKKRKVVHLLLQFKVYIFMRVLNILN